MVRFGWARFGSVLIVSVLIVLALFCPVLIGSVRQTDRQKKEKKSACVSASVFV